MYEKHESEMARIIIVIISKQWKA